MQTFSPPRLETFSETKLVGKHLTMSLAANRTAELWQSFMPRRKEIANHLSTDLFSIQLYPPAFDFTFSDLAAPFEKWAAVAVSDFHPLPPALEPLTIPGGLYAVFDYKGLSTDPAIFVYIFGTWLPASEYAVAHRPHFEKLGANYKNGEPNSEEEIWVPIQRKGG